MREWLNNEFYNAAFNTAEKQFIKTNHCTDNGEGCDKDLSEIHSNDLRRAVGTDFAKTKKSNGCSYIS
jgi:hypothetical protein